jgi:hypothetical protein
MPHLVAQDDGQEVAEAVADDVVEQVQPRVFPDLPVAQVQQDRLFGQPVDGGVAPVAVDAAQDDAGFGGREEGTPGYDVGLRGFVGEVDDGYVA